jgi:hypothetical protein
MEVIVSNTVVFYPRGCLAIPELRLEVSIICLLDLAGLHHNLGRRATDGLFEAYEASSSELDLECIASAALPDQDMMNVCLSSQNAG